ncbi:MAG: hypothetical protein QOH49_93 [Acidobacteriota bacterium]|jgi:hypothetical protein|nr:hypothetical protein [Acidobacteriota bacterium]
MFFDSVSSLAEEGSEVFAVKNKESSETKADETPAPANARGDVGKRMPVHQQGHTFALSTGAIQPKLAVSQPGDLFEQEADRVAESVMRMPDTTVRLQRKCACGGGACALCGEKPSIPRLPSTPPPLQRKPGDEFAGVENEEASAETTAADEDVPRDVSEEGGGPEEGEAVQTKRSPFAGAALDATKAARVASRGGAPLPDAVRSFFEPRFGFDFSRIRIHTGAEAAGGARAISARAYTVGRDIVFGAGEYAPSTAEGKRLLAHELTHVVQQSGGAASESDAAPTHFAGRGASAAVRLIQRDPKKKKNGVTYKRYQVFVPKEFTTLDQMFRLFERTAYGREVNHNWECRGYCIMESNRGKVIPFQLQSSTVERFTDPIAKEEKRQSRAAYDRLTGKKKAKFTSEVDKRYYDASGAKPGTKINPSDEGAVQQWHDTLDEVMKEKTGLESLPPALKELMGPDASYKPKDYKDLLRIAEKVKLFTPQDLVAYKLLAIRATDDLKLFEKSVDMFLERKEELTKAVERQQQEAAGQKEPTLEGAIKEKWKGLDEGAIAKMSEDERYRLALRKTSELTDAQLKHMAENPGETLKDFAKSATLVNTPETFSAIGKDVQEAAKGDANAWARWAAGAGAGAKLSGWLLAVAGVLYVASWLTGVGALATIAAGAAILLGSTLTLSAVESELRIKAASQATTPEEFKRNVELAAAARANVIVGVALIVVAAVLHFTAKALFPETLKKLSTSLKNFREKVRLKGSIYELKPQITAEMGTLKAEVLKSAEAAKQKALTAAEEIGKLTTEEFVERLEKGDGGFLDQSKVPAEQKLNFRELLKMPEGRAGIETYRSQLVNALKTEVIQTIERLAQEYGSKIDEFLKEVEAAKNHDDLNAATDKIEGTLTEEHAKKFMQGEQEKVLKEKLQKASEEVGAEIERAKAESEAKAAAEAKAKAEAEAVAATEEASAQQWYDDLSKTLSKEGLKKLAAIRKGQGTAKATRAFVEGRGGEDFIEGRTAAKVVSDPAQAALIKALENDPAFLSRARVQQAKLMANKAVAADIIRSELAAETTLRRAQAAYAGKPGIQIYEGVKVLREQPGFKTAAEYKAANPNYRGPVYERGGKVYKPVTDIDLLVTEKPASGPETMLEMGEIKSGALDTPGGAKGQIDNAKAAMNDLANGDTTIRLELTDGTDVTGRFDPNSAATAKTVTTGPASSKTGWTQSLGITPEDLAAIAAAIIGK